MADDVDDELSELDAFLEESPPEEHDDWDEWGSGYYAGVSVTIGVIGDRGFLMWNAFEGTEHGWEEWDGERCDADAAAEAFAIDMAVVDGGQPASTETFGLQNLVDVEALPPGLIRLGTLECFHAADDDASYPSFAMYGADDGAVLVTRRLSNEVIGRFNTLADAKAAFNPPGFIGAGFHHETAVDDESTDYEDWAVG